MVVKMDPQQFVSGRIFKIGDGDANECHRTGDSNRVMARVPATPSVAKVILTCVQQDKS